MTPYDLAPPVSCQCESPLRAAETFHVGPIAVMIN